MLRLPTLRARPPGRRGERVAARWLRRRRYRILARNLRTRVGEVDLLCLAPDRRTLVVVEVKSRRAADGRQPPPEAALTARKRRKLLLLLEVVAKGRGWLHRPRRIDLVAVDLGPGRPVVRHYEDAVAAP